MLAAVLIKGCLTRNLLLNNLEVIPRFRNVTLSSLPRSSVHTQAVRGSLSLSSRLWSNIVSKNSLLRSFTRRQASQAKLDYTLTRPRNNVFLYKNEEKGFRLIRVFCICQFFVWIGLSSFIYHPELMSIFTPGVSIGEYLKKCGLHLIFFLWPFVAGIFITVVVSAYLSRTVKYIILHKDGELVSVITHSLFNKDHKITRSVSEVNGISIIFSCTIHTKLICDKHYILWFCLKDLYYHWKDRVQGYNTNEDQEYPVPFSNTFIW